MTDGWYEIIDRRTGDLLDGRAWLSQDRAEQQITAWQDAHAAGSKQFTRNQLLNAEMYYSARANPVSEPENTVTGSTN